ncbi:MULTISPECIES: bifunctional 3,4-dihydroxy-2-butanone 4-phosphate synthase/GTP cyclohydrolase II [unclassified Campylobacter]|uniref:bifunctional 3,4-dihydroxy-2-butanone 4-phosphate synthase/GTP cyclohydrolase II n=1 Tax=unclassified Campylobacter TaxID=2593542 RepID=UPI001238191F|nr:MULTISPECIES: bifunctional 3,4-dihydroxy-2-butanone 4-phosphate synthase/GTP cyclohydrolase II [unclassified Campylobacter]KAA6225016.1 bifunctional 3,4-dihydroxy-2-butanone 4-phosphate synthase/GTP cyclohydrolase II [Campylobacter sp. LR185c]KAA6225960.1 bifunctional 3,4-dihydroxy-2-butanone 4-phosphate synthase/GTP cyclohydrolase II [Campylobacter sp. LR286c]KAA6225975.1 bifunctional 3,4-dihydroxy-2-butanone 4-phosphate synthase/GTP cyclohydrolase II [Campylobacter sp. LR196d]KAA6230346.1 
MKFVSVEQAIKDLQDGKMLVMVDAEDRENEGDLIFAAQYSTKEKINFTIKEARGVLCVALHENLAKHFDLPLMVNKNTSNHETAFTITVDSKDATTGVSAYERDMTIKIFTDENASSSDFVRPGHINPLIAKKGGVLERTGHTEGGVDLCNLAGLKQACVICEIVKDDGDMARRIDLENFCQKHNLNMIAVSDIIEYRLKNESLIKLVEQTPSILAGFRAEKFSFKDHNGITHIAFCFGEIKKEENVKFHISGSDFELLTSDKFSNLLKQIEFLSKNGGIIIFMQGEKSNATHFKNYGIGAQILRYFNIEEIKLLSKHCDKDFIALKGFGLDIKTCSMS